VKKLPIKSAKEFAEKYKQNQVLIVTWDAKEGLVHTVSYGKTLEDCDQASQGMNLIRTTLGFPKEKTNLLPNRVRGDYDRAESALGLHEPFKPQPELHKRINNHRLAGIVAWGLRKVYGLKP